jgi:SAM-dependent methyltransferase
MLRLLGRRRAPVHLQSQGHCPTCDQATRFVACEPWLRDHFVCTRCGSIPRERALMLCIERFFPAWRSLVIHESSPVGRGASTRLRAECPAYSASQFYPGAALGEIPPGREFPNEDLERLTLPDASLDLFVTQDVMEHILDPARAFAEIRRVLRPGGAHVFSVPLVSKDRPTRITAERGPDGAVVHHVEPTYHGNPVDSAGALVTREWGYDICDFIMRTAGTPTTMVVIDDLSRGIRAEYIEILVSRRSA